MIPNFKRLLPLAFRRTNAASDAPPVVRAPGSKVSAGAARPVMLSNYTTHERELLIKAVKQGKIPPQSPVVMGTYGINKAEADEIHQLSNGVYAPLVAPQRKEHPVRDLRGATAGGLPSEVERYDRLHPELTQYKGHQPNLDTLSPAQRKAWGVEMGRRIRDSIRNGSTARVADPTSPTGYRLDEKFHVDSFQLDEIWPSASKNDAAGKRLLQFFGGVMKGVREGRPELGDKPMRGSVFIAHPGRMAHLPHSPEKTEFLRQLNQTATFIVGEAYPNFKGGKAGADKAAHLAMDGARGLMDDGPDGRALARRYTVGGTPGMKAGRSLGGRLHESNRGARPTQSIEEANRWRSEFIRESVREGSHGFSEFSFTVANPKFFARKGLNHTQGTMNRVLDQVGAALAG